LLGRARPEHVLSEVEGCALCETNPL
jgi:hypothetical protein